MMKQVSVIIPAYNEEKFIHNAILSAQAQRRDNLEVIVVANGCTDATAQKARYLGANRVIELDQRSISVAKNVGYEHAQGDRIIFLDADTKMRMGTIKKICRSLDSGYSFGKVKLESNDRSFKAQLYFAYVNACSQVSRVSSKVHPGLVNGAGACTYATRDILERIKVNSGFVYDPELIRLEDVDLFTRLAKESKMDFIRDSSVVTSTRRLKVHGYTYNFFMDWLEFVNNRGIREREDMLVR
jgi:glycosyltransferase involved in cell wall biosynthesis